MNKQQMEAWVLKNCKFAQVPPGMTAENPAPTSVHAPVSRPKNFVPIDWDLVAHRTEEGLVLSQIAKELGINYYTLRGRFVQQFPSGTPLFQKAKDNLAKSQGERARKQWEEPGFRQKMTEDLKGRWADPNSDYRQKMTERARKQWEDPNFRKMMTEMAPENARKNWANPEFRQMMTAMATEQWNDPNFKQMMAEIVRKHWDEPGAREMMGERSKEMWKNPEFRQKQMARPNISDFWKWLATFPPEKGNEIFEAMKARTKATRPAAPVPA